MYSEKLFNLEERWIVMIITENCIKSNAAENNHTDSEIDIDERETREQVATAGNA